jgi:hypothetical protein
MAQVPESFEAIRVQRLLDGGLCSRSAQHLARTLLGLRTIPIGIVGHLERGVVPGVIGKWLAAGSGCNWKRAAYSYSCETVKYRPIFLRRTFQRKRPKIRQIGRYLSVYPVPICARAHNFMIPGKLDLRGHHDWPDKRRSHHRSWRSLPRQPVPDTYKAF